MSKIKMYLYLDEPAAGYPIHSRPDMVYVSSISGNTCIDEDAYTWESANDGFLGLADFSALVGFDVPKLAKDFTAFYDVYPVNGKGEWFFEDSNCAQIFFDFLCRELDSGGFNIVS